MKTFDDDKPNMPYMGYNDLFCHNKMTYGADNTPIIQVGDAAETISNG